MPSMAQHRAETGSNSLSLLFWRNPELVRHARARLRPRLRWLTLSSGLTCALLTGAALLADSHSTAESSRHVLAILLGAQYAALGLGCSYWCGQAISAEREKGTLDLLRTSRLTPLQIVIGKLLGEPVSIYYAVGVSLFFSLPAALVAGIGWWQVLLVYLLLGSATLLVGLFSLWLSMLFKQPSPAAPVVISMAVLTAPWGSLFPADGHLPGLAALGVLPGITSHLGRPILGTHAPVFGAPVDFAFLTFLLHSALGCLLLTMLVSNIKVGRDDIRPLNHEQALYAVLFANVILCALLAPRGEWRVPDMVRVAAALNATAVTATGILSAASLERLRRAGACSSREDALRWAAADVIAPAILKTAIGCAMTAAVIAARRGSLAGDWGLFDGAGVLALATVFGLRDVLFAQYWKIRTSANEVAGGAFLLLIYHGIAVALLAILNSSDSSVASWLGGLTPYWPRGFRPGHWPVLTGVSVQVVLGGIILFSLASRLISARATGVPFREQRPRGRRDVSAPEQRGV